MLVAHGAVHEPLRGRPVKTRPITPCRVESTHEKAGVLGFGSLVQRPRGGSCQSARGTRPAYLRLELALRLGQRVRGIHDEIIVLLSGAQPVTRRADRGGMSGAPEKRAAATRRLRREQGMWRCPERDERYMVLTAKMVSEPHGPPALVGQAQRMKPALSTQHSGTRLAVPSVKNSAAAAQVLLGAGKTSRTSASCFLLVAPVADGCPSGRVSWKV